MKALTVILGLVLTIGGCTFQVEGQEGDDMKILGPKQTANIGKESLLSLPNAAGGEEIITKDFEFTKLNSESLDSPQNLTLTFDSLPILNTDKFTAAQVLVQAVIKFNVGSSNFGMQEEPPALVPFVPNAFVTDNFSAEIIVDIGRGTTIVIPAAVTVSINLRLTAVNRTLFANNDIPAPTYRVNMGFSYGVPKSTPVTKTSPYFTLQNGESCMFVRPKFARSVRFFYQDFAVNGPLKVFFVSANGQVIWDTITPGPSSADTNPPEYIWTEAADYVLLTNNSGKTISQIYPVNELYL